MNYLINIKGISAKSHIGAFQKEKKNKQKVVVDLILKVKDLPKNDDLNEVVDYIEIINDARKIISNSNYDLVESLAEKIKSELEKNSKIQNVKVILKKPKIKLKKAKNVSVELS